MATILAQITSLKTVTLANEDVISSIEAGFIGTYGEWHYSNNFGSGSKSFLENPTNITFKNNRITVGRAIINDLTTNRMVAFRTPYYQQIIIPPTVLCTDCAKPSPYNNSIRARTAAHNDCFLSDADDMGTYESSPISTDKDYVEYQTRFTFDGGETCRNATIPSILTIIRLTRLTV